MNKKHQIASKDNIAVGNIYYFYNSRNHYDEWKKKFVVSTLEYCTDSKLKQDNIKWRKNIKLI